MDERFVYILLGAAIGAAFTSLKDVLFNYFKGKKHRQYLAIRVSSVLDSFSEQCAAVVADDGLYNGEPDEWGCRSIQVLAPKFEPSELHVEWSSIPTSLMYEILSLPSAVDSAAHRVQGAFEYAASQPDYEEGFEERHLQYSMLGLRAHDLSEMLKELGGIPPRERPSQESWDPISFMRERRSLVKSTIDARSKAISSQLSEGSVGA